MAGKDVSTMLIAPKIWKNGQLVEWDNAKIHVMSHVVNYGSSVFEGIRCYTTSNGPAVFRLTEHMQRLLNSAKIYRMDSKFTRDEFCEGTIEVIRDSGLEHCYIRPIIFRGLDEEKPAFGVNPFPNPIDSYIAVWQWGQVSRRRGPRNRYRYVRFKLDADHLEFNAGYGKGRSELYEFAAYQDGGYSRRILRRYCS